MSAPTPLTEMELVRQLCAHAEGTLARANHQIDRLSAELAATKSCLAAANDRISAQDVLMEKVTLRFGELDAVLVRCAGSIPQIEQWAASAALILLRRLLSVEAPRQNYKPRLQVLAPLGATGNDEEKGAAK